MSRRSPRANRALLLVGFAPVVLLLGRLALDGEMPGLIRIAMALLGLGLAMPAVYLFRWVGHVAGDRSDATGPPARSVDGPSR
ncbi:hypothetical protein AB0B85_11090 [Micromonospora sp. NPDC049044]|uniref:hypothetical protein n=1 Tax=unclassified Micromonospora TaxID=2617518 RepID=UPI0033FD4F7C